MSDSSTSPGAINLPTDPWPDASRVESWAGELRVNLIRIVALVLFYGRHLIEMMMAGPGASVRGAYHVRVTVVVVAWAALAVAVHVLLSRRQYPPGMKYITSLADLFMVTALCAIAGGPQTPLVLLYFAVLTSTPLRLSLRLVYATTAGAILGYLVLLAYYAWYVIGFHRYYASPELRIPRGQEAIVVLCLGVAGLFAGQIVRQARRMVESNVTVAAAATVAPTNPQG